MNPLYQNKVVCFLFDRANPYLLSQYQECLGSLTTQGANFCLVIANIN